MNYPFKFQLIQDMGWFREHWETHMTEWKGSFCSFKDGQQSKYYLWPNLLLWHM